MKSGIAFFIYAARALRELDIPVARRVVLQVNSDEEVGSDSSRPLTEEAARGSAAVLVLEPGTGMSGKIKTARKGVGEYTVKVHGRASHSGVDFENGASAIVELARQIERIATFTNLKTGITVNPGVIAGGTRSNVIAAEAWAEVDMRIARLKDAPALDKKFHSLRPIDKRCSIEVTGGMNRPPMERTPGIRKLFETARTSAARARRGPGRILHRRRLRRQFHSSPRNPDPGRPRRRRRRRARPQRKHPDQPDRRPHGVAGNAAVKDLATDEHA